MQKGMKAIVLESDGAIPKVKEIPLPDPGPGEVLVKMHSSPINPSDLSFIRGGYGVKKPYPVVPGFEGSGTVVAAGKGFLPKLWKGKQVSCAASPKHNGCWAEYMVTSANLCVPFSKNISFEQAAMMFVNPMTAIAFFDIFKRLAKTDSKPEGMINTAAASALGRMIIKLGRQKGIPVISIVRRDEQIKMLKDEGAEYVLNSESDDFNEKLKELSNRLNTKVIFDAVAGKLTQQILQAVPNDSKIFIYGRLSSEPMEINPSDMIYSGNQIQGFWLNNWLKNKNMIQNIRNTRKIQALLSNELSTHIQDKFPPEKVIKAIETYRNNMSEGKVLIQF